MTVDAPVRPADQERGRRSIWRALVGGVWAIAAAVCAVLARGSLLASHPAYVVTLAVVFVIGLLLLASGRARRRGERRARPVLTVVGRVLAGLLTVAVVGSLFYLVPHTATQTARSAMFGTTEVAVDDSLTRITLTPQGKSPTTGLVFQPGAKVDPRAYVPLLTRVAAAGYLVVVVKQPYDIGFLALGTPDEVMDDHDDIGRWVVGGHSLGGVAAGQYAGRRDTRVRGLVLWASYPLDSLADRSDLAVASISGTQDGLTTPADIEASRAKLPATTTFTAVPGAVHGSFGDYGTQPGDGTPTGSRATAQDQIVAATVALMAKVASAS